MGPQNHRTRSFIGHSGTPVIGCSYKAAAGHLYPLERGFIYVHKPPIHIRFEEIASVNFARGGGTTRSFDFEVETKNGVVHTFSSIEKEEYGKLYDFITSKKLRVKNTGRSDKFRTVMTLVVPTKKKRPMPILLVLKLRAKNAMLKMILAEIRIQMTISSLAK